MVAGITGPQSRLGEPTGEEAPARGGVGTLPSSAGGGVGALPSSSTTLLVGGVLAASLSLVGVPAVALARAGCSSVLSAAFVAADCSVVYGAASLATATGSAALWPAMWSGSTSNAALTRRQHLTNVKSSNKTQNISQYGSKIENLQVRAPVRHGEEPPPGPTGRCLCPCLYDTRRLDVWGRRVAGHPTSGGRRNVWTTAQSPDQRRCGLLLLVVVGDLDELTLLWRLAALCRQRLRRGRVRHQWPLPRYSVFGGRGGTVLLLLAAGVLRTLSSVVPWRVYSRGILHARCQ